VVRGRGGVHVIGEEARVAGFRLAGAVVHVASDEAAACNAWRGLDDDCALVLVTPRVAAALGRRLRADGRLTCVLPEPGA
jgi:vacuolar-type H+-ATPase subunit F/Vma7